MNKPYIDSISTKSDSKYLLIVAAAKRARQITINEPELTRSGKVNPVSQALHEINDDELTWEIGNSDSASDVVSADLEALSCREKIAEMDDVPETETVAEDLAEENTEDIAEDIVSEE